MRNVRSDYDYRRFLKPIEGGNRPPPADMYRDALRQRRNAYEALQQFANQRPPERRDEILLKTAKAGRGLYLN